MLKPGGTVVAGFRNREGLRYLARVQSWAGDACDLSMLGDVDVLARLGDDDGVQRDEEYVTRSDVERAFAGFASAAVIVRNLTPDDLPGFDRSGYPPEFWRWVADRHGRFILVRATL